MPAGARFAALYASLVASGCAGAVFENGAPQNYLKTAWALRPLPTGPASASRPVKDGALLFEQPLSAASVAVLERGVEIPVPPATTFSRSPGTVAFPAGERLIEIAGLVDGHRGYCDAGESWRAGAGLDGRRLRFCLVDTDRDEIFDFFMWTGLVAPGEFRNGVTLSLADGFVSAPFRIEAGARPLMRAGLRIASGSAGSYRVEFSVVGPRGVEPLRTDGALRRIRLRTATGLETKSDVAIFSVDDLPATVEAEGATLIFEAAENGRAVYTIASEFDEDRRLLIGYSDILPIEN